MQTKKMKKNSVLLRHYNRRDSNLKGAHSGTVGKFLPETGGKIKVSLISNKVPMCFESESQSADLGQPVCLSIYYSTKSAPAGLEHFHRIGRLMQPFSFACVFLVSIDYVCIATLFAVHLRIFFLPTTTCFCTVFRL